LHIFNLFFDSFGCLSCSSEGIYEVVIIKFIALPICLC